MSASSSHNRGRPLSPHLSIWRWGPAMAVSIIHRISGNALTFVGLPLLLWWLGALASGPEAYAGFEKHASAWYGLIVLIGLSWAFFLHLASGLRHFVLDVGAGYELDTNKFWATATTIGGFVLTALFWAAVLLR